MTALHTYPGVFALTIHVNLTLYIKFSESDLVVQVVV